MSTKQPHPLTRYRIEHGMTRTEMAQYLGFSRSYLHRIESGERQFGITRLEHLRRKTGLSTQDLRPDLHELLTPKVVGKRR